MILTIFYDVRCHFFPIWSKICQKSLCLTVLERLRLYEASLGSFVVINNIVLNIKLNADCDSDIIFWYKMIFFSIWSKICQKSLFLTVLERLGLYKACFGSFVVIKTLF